MRRSTGAMRPIFPNKNEMKKQNFKREVISSLFFDDKKGKHEIFSFFNKKNLSKNKRKDRMNCLGAGGRKP